MEATAQREGQKKSRGNYRNQEKDVKKVSNDIPKDREEKPRYQKPEYKQEHRPRLPPIHLEKDIKEIKLTEEQDKQVKELEASVRLIGEVIIPDQDTHAKEIEEIEKGISNLKGRIHSYRNLIEELEARKEAIIKQNNPRLTESSEIKARITSLSHQISDNYNSLKVIEGQASHAHESRKQLRMKFKYDNPEAIKEKIEEIEYKIETNSFSNTVLRKHLTEIDSLQKTLSQLGDIPKVDEQIDRLHKQKDEIFKQIGAQKEERDILFKRIEAITQSNQPNKEETDKIYAQIKEHWGNLKQTEVQLKEMFAKKNNSNEIFYNNLHSSQDKRAKVAELKHQILQIYKDAERRMKILEDGARKAGEITDVRNPKETEIVLAKSLVSYLENLIVEIKEADEEKEKDLSEKHVSQATQSLIASLRKDKKAKKPAQQKKAPNSKLIHDAHTIQEFARLDIQIPKTIEEVKPLIESLKLRITEWKSAFVRASLRFEVNEDGSVKTSIFLD